MKSRTFLESSEIYHSPIICHLKESGFEVFVINPLFAHSIKTALHTVFQQYLALFSDILGTTSKMIPRQYPTPDKILRGHKNTMIEKIAKLSRKGLTKATERYKNKVDSIFVNIQLKLDLIDCLDLSISKTMERFISLLEEYKDHTFVNQIHLLDNIPDVGLLTAVSIMCEIADFSAFSSPKQLFAYFGMEPNVNESGKFKGTEVHMSKRGSRIARRVTFAIALASIRIKRNGEALNP